MQYLHLRICITNHY